MRFDEVWRDACAVSISVLGDRGATFEEYTMTGWLIFQLLFDIAVCVLVIWFAVRDKKRYPDIEGLRGLLTEFKTAVERSEKAALSLDAKLKSALAQKPAKVPDEIKGNGRPHKGSASDNVIEEHKRKVEQLHKQGLTKDEISRQLSIPLPEVELIIAMLPGND